VRDSDEAIQQAKEAYTLALKAGASESAAIGAACVVYRRWRGDLQERVIRETVRSAVLDQP
jgi:hypothetical protein